MGEFLDHGKHHLQLLLSNSNPRSPVFAHADTSRQDHILFGPAYEVNVLSSGRLSDPQFAAQQLDMYNRNRSGLFTSTGADLVGALEIA